MPYPTPEMTPPTTKINFGPDFVLMVIYGNYYFFKYFLIAKKLDIAPKNIPEKIIIRRISPRCER